MAYITFWHALKAATTKLANTRLQSWTRFRLAIGPLEVCLLQATISLLFSISFLHTDQLQKTYYTHYSFFEYHFCSWPTSTTHSFFVYHFCTTTNFNTTFMQLHTPHSFLVDDFHNTNDFYYTDITLPIWLHCRWQIKTYNMITVLPPLRRHT